MNLPIYQLWVLGLAILCPNHSRRSLGLKQSHLHRVFWQEMILFDWMHTPVLTESSWRHVETRFKQSRPSLMSRPWRFPKTRACDSRRAANAANAVQQMQFAAILSYYVHGHRESLKTNRHWENRLSESCLDWEPDSSVSSLKPCHGWHQLLTQTNEARGDSNKKVKSWF